MRVKSFFYVCTGVLMLAIAYHLGASNAQAQLGGDFAGIAATPTGVTVAITSAGDVYVRNALPAVADCNTGEIGWSNPCGGGFPSSSGWVLFDNVLGGTISVDPATLGDVKGKYKDEE